MKKIKKLVCLSIVFLLLVSMLVACSSSAGSSASATDTSGITSDSVSDENGESDLELSGEIRFVRLEDHKRDTVVEEMGIRFPDVKIVEEIVPFENLDSKINMAHASGQGYDFIQVNNSSVKQFYAAGVLEPLDHYLERDGIVLEENYGQSLLDIGSVDGVKYAISYAPDCRLLAYNKKILDEYGFKEPDSQADILAIAEAVSGDGIYAFSRRMDTPLAPAYIEGCFFLANGAQICTEEDGKVIASCDTPEMIESVEWWKSLTPYMPKDPNMSDDQCKELFAQGKCVFFVFGPWELTSVVGETMKYGEDYNLIVTPGSAGTGATAGGWFVGIGADSKNKEAAWQFMKISLEPEMVAQMAASLPADNRCYDMPPFNEPVYDAFVEGLNVAQPPFPVTEQFNKINDIFFEYFNKVLIGGEDTASAMAMCDAEIEKALAE